MSTCRILHLQRMYYGTREDVLVCYAQGDFTLSLAWASSTEAESSILTPKIENILNCLSLLPSRLCSVRAGLQLGKVDKFRARVELLFFVNM